MKAFVSFIALVAIMMALVLPATSALADTLVLTSGERVSGYFEGGTARVVKFRSNGGDVKEYDILSVQQVEFNTANVPGAAAVSSATIGSTPSIDISKPTTTVLPTASAPAPQPVVVTPSAPQLLSAADRPASPPVSAVAAGTSYTFPTGSKIAIRMVDSISSEKQIAGTTFVATLDEPIVSNGVTVVPKGADVRGRISKLNDAGGLTGSAQLGLELTQIFVNGVSYAVTTSEYNEVGESRTGQTVTRTGIGAGIGAVIGAIAGGGKGAAIGAGVGGGGAAAVQVMTKGEKLNIPSETKLEFTLRTPLVIAGK